MPTATRVHARRLWVVFGLFLLRVVAQPLALVVDAPFWPPFEAWHSGAMPYPALVLSQLLILLALGQAAWRFSTGQVTRSRSLGLMALGLGGIYFGVMALRLILGWTLLADQRWFASPLPTMFHLVLAYGLLVYGHAVYHAAERPDSDR